VRARLGPTRAWPWALRLVTALNAALLALLVLAIALPLPGRAIGWSTVVEYRDGRPAYVFLSPDQKWRLETSLDRVDPRFVASLIALEDKRFWSHDGVDPIAVARAAWTDAVHRRVVSGGSTLSMQLARLIDPQPRTIHAKLVEMFRAVQLDLRLSKREILEAYLSRTPYGGNVEGLEAAAWTYFGHDARRLTPLEIATLLAVPQGPARYAPSPANVARLRARRDDILGKLIAAGVFAPADARAALADAAATAPPDHLRAMPREASHAAVWLHERHPDLVWIRTTLDAGAQETVEHAVHDRAADLARRGIFGAAIVVVDHRSRDVVALVGNLDADDAKHGGQIEMFDRPRSTGSTLKPFLYALAIDRGLALPGYLVPDVPRQFGTYRPRNFNGDWSGLVTLEDALGRSLNLPFVDLLDRVGVPAFLTELASAGVTEANAPAGEYGLSLIVGGLEVPPLELAGLYAMLAEDGRYAPPRLLASDPRPAPVTVFGAGAAWLTRQALSKKDRPDFPRRRELDATPPQIHWKTGTSYGFRDAWAAGSGPRYTAVVWTGNPDRTPSTELVGSQAAGPILFDVLEALADRAHPPPPDAPPPDLTWVDVCPYSGHIASDACPDRVKVLAPIHAVPTEPCPYHRAYDVDVATHRAVLPPCRTPGRDYERESFVVLPSAVVAWLEQRQRAVPDAPVFADGCADDRGGAPIVLTPAEGEVITLVPGVRPEQQKVPLSASTHGAALTWFVDGALVGTVPASRRLFWTPTLGTHEVVVADPAGHTARRTLEVRAL
jgi:penicillin-binding protein 1C